MITDQASANQSKPGSGQEPINVERRTLIGAGLAALLTAACSSPTENRTQRLSSSGLVTAEEGDEGTDVPTGLDWQGNTSFPEATPNVGFLWRIASGSAVDPPLWSQLGVFYQRVKPRSQFGGYYSGLFYIPFQTVFDGAGLRYFGNHPYPFNAEDPSGTWAPYLWETSINGADVFDNDSTSPGYGDITTSGWDRWYDQFTIINDTAVDYYWDWPSTTRRLSTTLDDTHLTQPADPCMVVGYAPHNANEIYCGVISKMQVWLGAPANHGAAITACLNDTSSQTTWYKNRSLHPNDITDKSGTGNNPAWVTENSPLLYTGI